MKKEKLSSASLDYCGVILTRMRWNNPLWWTFNAALLVYQLIMLSAGKLIGKVKAGWREIWDASHYCHVRMVLQPEPGKDTWKAISFTAPEAKYDWWSVGAIVRSKGHFVYLQPTFERTQAMIDHAIEAAQAKMGQKVGRKYDYLQLLSFLVNLLIWLVYWPSWGKQVIGWFNLPGGREVCSTAITAILRWAAGKTIEFFAGCAIAMVSPCLFAISRNWKRVRFENG